MTTIKSDDNTVYFNRATQKDWVLDGGKQRGITKREAYHLVINEGWAFTAVME